MCWKLTGAQELRNSDFILQIAHTGFRLRNCRRSVSTQELKAWGRGSLCDLVPWKVVVGVWRRHINSLLSMTLLDMFLSCPPAHRQPHPQAAVAVSVKLLAPIKAQYCLPYYKTAMLHCQTFIIPPPFPPLLSLLLTSTVSFSLSPSPALSLFLTLFLLFEIYSRREQLQRGAGVSNLWFNKTYISLAGVLYVPHPSPFGGFMEGLWIAG